MNFTLRVHLLRNFRRLHRFLVAYLHRAQSQTILLEQNNQFLTDNIANICHSAKNKILTVQQRF